MRSLLVIVPLLTGGFAASAAADAPPSEEVDYMHASQPISEAMAKTCIASAYALDAISDAVDPKKPSPVEVGYIDFWQGQLDTLFTGLGADQAIRQEANAILSPFNAASNEDDRRAAYTEIAGNYGICWIRKRELDGAANG